jgi:hypothetical protein
MRIMLMVCVLLVLGFTGCAWAGCSPEIAGLNLSPEKWVGHDFIFLDLPADKQSEGYDIYTEEQAIRGFQGDRSVRIPYAGYAGKQVTVTDVVTYAAGYNQHEYIVYLKVNATGKKLVGRTMRGQLEGLVLEGDLTNARQQFVGKTIYVKRRMLQGEYNPRINETPVAVATRIGMAAQVIDVYRGIQSREPIWLVVLVNCQRAIIPIAYSYTNQEVNAWLQTPPWQEELFMEDPRAKIGWSEGIWDLIEAGIVQEGMTKDQVRLSWGAPQEENTDGSGKTIWRYGTKVLGFTGTILTSVGLLK